MSREYKGGSLPPNLDPKMRRLLEDHDQALTRGLPRSNITVNVAGGGGGSSGPPSQISYQVSGVEGNVGTIPAQPNGSTVIFRFTGSPTLLTDSGNLHLNSNFSPLDPDETITLVSDGVGWFEISRGRNGSLGNVFVPAAIWGATPHATQDRTTHIQAAFTNCPLGATLVFEPGTYFISNTLTLSRTINIWAYGVIFDLELNIPTTTFSPGIPENHDGVGYLTLAAREAGTLTNLAALIWGISGTNRPERNNIWGLHVSRNAGANTAAARLYAGIVLKAPFECTLHNCRVNNFREGLVLVGGDNFEGCAYNRIYDLKSTDCRYPITLYTNQNTGNGYANENLFVGGRCQLSSSIYNDADFVANFVRWEQVRLLYESGPGTIGAPNNNTFYHLNMESAAPEGRKIRCEGRDNRFDQCRYENSGVTAITIGEASRTNSNWTRNIFSFGDTLNTIIDNQAIEFLASVSTGVNNKNVFMSGWGTMWAGGNTEPLLELQGGSDNSLLLALAEATSTRDHRLTARAVHPSYASGSGFVGWHNAAGTLIGGLTLDTAGSLGGATPLALRSLGLWINQNLDDRDSRVSGDIETNLTYWDANADPGSGAASGCVGFGTLSPNRLVDIEIATAPQLRLTHTSGSRYTDLHEHNDATYGGLALLPAANASALSVVTLFGLTEGTGLTFLDDPAGGGLWLRTTQAKHFIFNTAASNAHMFKLGFADRFWIQDTLCTFFVPSKYAFIAASTNVVEIPLLINRQSSGGVGADGIGAGIQWEIEDSSGAGNLQAEWHVVLDDADTGTSIDSSTRFRQKVAGALTEIMRIGGAATAGVRIESGVAGVPAELLDVRGAAIFNEDGASVNTRFEGDTDPNLLFISGVADRIGIGTEPNSKLHVLLETADTNGPLDIFRIERRTSGTAASGIGGEIRWVIENGSGSAITAGNWRGILDTVTAGAEDSSFRFLVVDGGATKETVRIDGSLPGVLFHNGATAVPLERLEVDANIRCLSLRLDGDTGAGVASTLTLTNVNTAVSGAVPAVLATTGGGPTAATQTHWLKIYHGTTVRYIPVFT